MNKNRIERGIEWGIARGFEKGFKFLFYGLFILLFMGLFGFVVQYLWNWIMPDLFGLPMLTYWKALGLLILSKIFFSGFGRKGHHNPGRRSWKRKFRQKWENMTEEDREKYRNCWRPSKDEISKESQNISEENQNLSSA